MPRLSHLLLIDPDAKSRYDTMMFIREARDCVITEAESQEDAYAKVKDIWFDLILVNCANYGEEGYDAASGIKALARDGKIEPVQIIGLTDEDDEGPDVEVSGGMLSRLKTKIKGQSFADVREKAITFGMDDLLLGPLSDRHINDNQIFKEVLPPASRRNQAEYSQQQHLSPKQEEALEVLDLDGFVTKLELKAQFRTLAKQWHPDLHEDKELAGAKFREINEAYEELLQSGQFPDQ